jgi:hypothetical protein
LRHNSVACGREEALHAVDTHGPLDGLTADEALIIRFGRELLESPQISDDTFNAVRARYGEKGLLELTAVMGLQALLADNGTCYIICQSLLTPSSPVPRSVLCVTLMKLPMRCLYPQ